MLADVVPAVEKEGKMNAALVSARDEMHRGLVESYEPVLDVQVRSIYYGALSKGDRSVREILREKCDTLFERISAADGVKQIIADVERGRTSPTFINRLRLDDEFTKFFVATVRSPHRRAIRPKMREVQERLLRHRSDPTLFGDLVRGLEWILQVSRRVAEIFLLEILKGSSCAEYELDEAQLKLSCSGTWSEPELRDGKWSAVAMAEGEGKVVAWSATCGPKPGSGQTNGGVLDFTAGEVRASILFKAQASLGRTGAVESFRVPRAGEGTQFGDQAGFFDPQEPLGYATLDLFGAGVASVSVVDERARNCVRSASGMLDV
jgi:hypothetical protein